MWWDIRKDYFIANGVLKTVTCKSNPCKNSLYVSVRIGTHRVQAQATWSIS